MQAALWVLIGVGAYAAAGLVVAVAFVLRGVTVVDHAAEHSRWTFRVLIVPGVVVLWPVMMGKWMKVRGTGPSPTRRSPPPAAIGGTPGAHS